jgi:hypothetical protein
MAKLARMDNTSQHPRRFFRFSLRALLLSVAAMALALAAMRFANIAWASAVVTITILALLASMAVAAGRRGERRSFWIGFALCGSGYLAVITTSLDPELVLKLATTQSIAFLRDKFHPGSDFQSAPVIGGGAFQVLVQPPANSGALDEPDAPLPLLKSQERSYFDPGSAALPFQYSEDYKAMVENFLLIGHCIWALIIAFVGGTLARFAAGLPTAGKADGSLI